MPYIKQELRESLHKSLTPSNVGELNYLLSCWMNDFIVQHGKNYRNLSEAMDRVRRVLKGTRSFSDYIYLPDRYINVSGLEFNEVERAVHDSIAEFYRRVAGPYEDTAIEKNGDCYDEILEKD